MPKQTGRAFRTLLRSFDVRGREDLAVPLLTGVMPVIDADLYDPTPMFIVGQDLPNELLERAVIEISTGRLGIWIDRFAVTQASGTSALQVIPGPGTAAPGPGAQFAPVTPQGSGGQPSITQCRGFTTLAGAPTAPFPILDQPFEFGPWSLRPFMTFRVSLGTLNTDGEWHCSFRELGFE